MSSRPSAVSAWLALLALLVACAPMPSTADPPSLDDTAWVLADLPGRSLVAGHGVTLRFEEGRALGSDGCNRYGSPFTRSGAALSFGDGGIATQMACPPEVMQQVEAFRASLAGTRSYRLAEDGHLQLVSADGTVLASFAPQSASLAGTSWQVTGFNNGRQAVGSTLMGSDLVMLLAADGRVGGSAGCNRYSSSYTADGSALRIGPAAATRRMCVEPAQIMEQEQQFLKALETVATMRHEGDRLELRTSEGALAVTLAKGGAGVR
jgi:heat shock protein HslJ